jgi:hypothetical protein
MLPQVVAESGKQFGVQEGASEGRGETEVKPKDGGRYPGSGANIARLLMGSWERCQLAKGSQGADPRDRNPHREF